MLGCGDNQGLLDVEAAAAELDGKYSLASNASPKPKPPTEPCVVLRRSRSFTLSPLVPDPQARATPQASSRDTAGGNHLVGLASGLQVQHG